MVALINPNENTPKAAKKAMLIKPYGTIPKHNKKKLSVSKKPTATTTATSAPYPFFSSLTTTSTSSFLSFINNLFSNEQQHCKDLGPPVGFMPRNTHHASKTQMSQLDVIVPVSVSSPIDCYYNDRNTDSVCLDNCSSLSTSSGSSNSESSLFSLYMDDDARDQVRNGLTDHSGMSTTALSDILCEHYVQTQMNMPYNSNNDDYIDVPLETFCMYEAPSPSSSSSSAVDNNQSRSISTLLLDEPPKEWILVETLSKQPKRLQPKPQSQEQVKEEEVPDEQVKVEEQQKDIVIMNRYYHDRDTRTNAAYLRMIVAEVNMMRAQKIVGPLRPRRVLPKRSDRFMHRPSPLQLIMV
ncbi:hypothetical protein [Parasitella parasitica]|uniref:Uncharacterized protein n=1 Tax=Parasitella parasitica TaxID=35722 RepID=A0A0B7N1K4_9FUNG|nr:hypothetical protein [Parasitella parasitica]